MTKSKLTLRKETVRQLSKHQLSDIVGGMQDTKTCTQGPQPSNSYGPTWCGNDSCWCILSDACTW